jgi:hypothetical protein
VLVQNAPSPEGRGRARPAAGNGRTILRQRPRWRLQQRHCARRPDKYRLRSATSAVRPERASLPNTRCWLTQCPGSPAARRSTIPVCYPGIRQHL